MRLRVSRLGFSLAAISLTLGTCVLASGCMSAYKRNMGGETNKVFSRIYLTDFNLAWQGVLEALKSYRLDISNREGGYIQTKWYENTADKNFIDSFGNGTAYLKAQMRYRISIGKGFYNGEPSVKVIVRKEQLVKMDVLEGWRPVETDATEENTLLYRIGRIIQVKSRIDELERKRLELEMKKADQELPTVGGGAAPGSEVKGPDEDLESFEF